MGELFKEGQSRPATREDLGLYDQAQALQAMQRVPLLQRADDAREYLFFAMFDGTGQDAGNRRQELTNIGVLKAQVHELQKDAEQRIAGRYVEGIGTQPNPLARVYDGVVAHTWDDKIEEAYRAFAAQAREWLQQDPNAEIRVVGVGYSRGAVLAAGFQRLVDEYGIVDPDDLRFGRDAHGNITVESTRPPLVPPGRTAQAAALLDPVATGFPPNYDARLPPSTISGFAVAAAHEQRVAFPHQPVVAPGLSDDRRSVNVLVPGGHSNAGGGGSAPALEAGTFNLMVDFLNGLRDAPLFAYRPLPEDPSLYSVYQVRGPTAVPGMDRDGLRNLRPELANCKIVDPCRDREPIDDVLAGRFEYRPLQPSAPVPSPAHLIDVAARDAGPVPPPSARSPGDPGHPDHHMLLQIRSGVRRIDQQAGKPYDDDSERLSRSLLAATRDNRDMYPGRPHAPLATTALTGVDHVVMGVDGRNVFAVQGGLHDPAHRRVHVEVATAISATLEQSDAKLEAARAQLERPGELLRHQSPGSLEEHPPRAVVTP